MQYRNVAVIHNCKYVFNEDNFMFSLSCFIKRLPGGYRADAHLKRWIFITNV